MQYFIIIIIVITYTFFGKELGFTYSSPLYTHFTYIFQHVGILHLCINSVAFLSIFNVLTKWINKYFFVTISFFAAFLCSFITAHFLPTVGISAVVYAMIGQYYGFTLFSPLVYITNKKLYLRSLLLLTVSLLFSYFNANSNFALHILCLSIGVIAGTLFSLRKNS